MKAYICVVYSFYFKDSLAHVEAVFDQPWKAEAFKEDYEKRVKENEGLTLPTLDNTLKNVSEDELNRTLDRYNSAKVELEKAKKFRALIIEVHEVR